MSSRNRALVALVRLARGSMKRIGWSLSWAVAPEQWPIVEDSKLLSALQDARDILGTAEPAPTGGRPKGPHCPLCGAVPSRGDGRLKSEDLE